MIRPARPLLALWAASATLSNIDAFTPTHRSSLASARLVPSTTSTTLYVDGPDPGTKIVSNRKEIAFDGTRFYETGLDDEECIPQQEYCIIDPDTSQPIRLTIEEKERMFLDALQSFYVSGRQVMDDAEFDALKEDLSWNGSEVVNLNRKEIAFLEAKQAYMKGTPMMSDAEFDTLKGELLEDGSTIAVDIEPKCYIDVSNYLFFVDEKAIVAKNSFIISHKMLYLTSHVSFFLRHSSFLVLH